MKKKLFNFDIRKIKYEDVKTLQILEKILISKRGYIFKKPSTNTPVILLMSGGLDSISTACYLIEKHKLKIYPLFIKYRQANLKKEESAFDYFSRLYKKRYKDYYQNPQKINVSIPAQELFTGFPKGSLALRNAAFAIHSVQYAYFLENTKGVKIRTIFCNSVAGDGKVMPDTTLTAIRATNLNICINESNFDWQYTSIALERTLGNYKSKSFFLKYALKKNIPIKKTWSCVKSGNIHCGKCIPCSGRKDAFFMAKVDDPTKYRQLNLLTKLKQKSQRKLGL